jgi:LPXTG-motif cell wall-anchored protein
MAPDLTVSPLTVAQGGSVDIVSHNWMPGASVEVILNSTPVTLGTLTADANGDVSGSFGIPVGTALGSHTIQLSGVASGGVDRILSAAITVVAQQVTTASTSATGTLPTTGSDSTRLTGIAMMLLGTGAALMLVRRRANA